MSEDENYFLRALDELRQLHNRNEPYSTLRATGILRMFILDEHPLIHRINKELRLPLMFLCSDKNLLEDKLISEGTVFLFETLDGTNVKEEFRLAKKLSPFLATPILYVRGNGLTVKNLILTCANCFGGVHRAPPKDKEQEAIAEFNDCLMLGNFSGAVHLAREIVAICIRGFEPFEAAIKSRG